MNETCILETARFGAYGNCISSIWTGAPRAGQLEVLEQLIRKLANEFTGGVALLVVVEPAGAMVDADGRKELDAFYARVGGLLNSVAQVVEGGNLWSVTARSMMTAIRLVQRRPYPTKVFSEVEEGVPWIVPYVTPKKGASASDLSSALLESLTELRAAPSPTHRVA